MKYEDVKKGFLSSVKDDDPYKSSKKLQIERWGRLWWGIVHIGGKRQLDFVIQVLSDEACWDITNDLYGLKLNVKKLGAKLVSAETTYAGQKNPIHRYERYSIACWCCFEEDIKSLFDKDMQNRGGASSEEDLIELIKIHNNGPLMIFWSHYINGYVNLINTEGKNAYIFGFECAMAEKHPEALEFFWEKIQSDTTISLEKKEELLIGAALYYSLNGAASADMIEFCLRHLEPSRYSELLKKDLQKSNSGFYSTLNQLISEHCIENVQILLNVLNPKDLSSQMYTILMFGLMRYTISLPDDYFVAASNDLTIFMLNRPGFEAHKQYFFNDLCKEFSSCRQVMAELVDMNRSEAVWKILDLASPDQIKLIMKFDDFSRLKIFIEFVGDRPSIINKLQSYCTTDGDNMNINPPSDSLVGSLTQAMAASSTKDSTSIKENTVNSDSLPLSNIVEGVNNVRLT